MILPRFDIEEIKKNIALKSEDVEKDIPFFYYYKGQIDLLEEWGFIKPSDAKILINFVHEEIERR